MILKLFSVFDSKAEAYLQPFFLHSRGEAIRGFSEVVNDPSSDPKRSMMAKYPADYTLFEIGSWDNSTCVFSLHKTPISLGVGIEFLREGIQPLADSRVPSSKE